MIALDTNVAVRYLLRDHPKQAKIAHDLIQQFDCLLTRTVILKIVWVLGSKLAGNLSRDEVLERMRHLLALPRIFVETPEVISQTLQWYENGMDFADALHLATVAGSVDEFATFDKPLASKADSLDTRQKILLLNEQ